MSGHGKIAWVVGETAPALSISWAPPIAKFDSGYIVFMADADPDDDEDAKTVCVHCLLEDGGEQLGRGLDLAKVHAQVDYDVDSGEWFVPEDAA